MATAVFSLEARLGMLLNALKSAARGYGIEKACPVAARTSGNEHVQNIGSWTAMRLHGGLDIPYVTQAKSAFPFSSTATKTKQPYNGRRHWPHVDQRFARHDKTERLLPHIK